MAIQSDETLVTKGDLKTLYTDKILPYLGGNMMMQTGVSDYYSEDEKVVGIWVNNKPVYQRTVITNTGTGDAQYSIASWNVDEVMGLNGVIEQEVNGIKYYPTIFFNGSTTYNCNVHVSPHDSRKAIIINTGSGYYNYRIFITIQYTKTTDTASSALTTPGCYDINRPDLWPNGQEIFFGNGLYGMRKAGTAAANSLQSGIVLVSNVSKTACCYNKGGMIDMSGTNGTNWYDINGGWDSKGVQRQFNPLLTNTDQTFRFYCQDNQNYTTQNIQYNIWFTYTK